MPDSALTLMDYMCVGKKRVSLPVLCIKGVLCMEVIERFAEPDADTFKPSRKVTCPRSLPDLEEHFLERGVAGLDLLNPAAGFRDHSR
jgi:hypothetical protein